MKKVSLLAISLLLLTAVFFLGGCGKKTAPAPAPGINPTSGGTPNPLAP